MFQPTLTNPTNGRNNDSSLKSPSVVIHADGPNHRLWGALTSSYNTQLRTKFGYYLLPKPTMQQLKK